MTKKSYICGIFFNVGLRINCIMKLIFKIVSVLLILFFNLNAGEAKKNISPDSVLLKDKLKIFIAQIDYGPKANVITDDKVEAAMFLACKMTKSFELIPSDISDSVIKQMNENKQKTTAMNVAKELNADRIYFIRISRLENILRADISSTNTKNGKKVRNGTGYAFVNFHDKTTDQPLYDPSLLKAIQRALATAENDSLMFDSAEGPFKVYPAASLVIGGIDIRDNPKFDRWNLFDKKLTTSFDASEVIFETSKNSHSYVAYDMSSRDSIYALFNMHIVENYRPPTSHEMEALSKLQVEYYITGLMQRSEQGATIELYLCKIKDKSLNIIRQENATVEKDEIEALRKVVRELTAKLLDIKN